MGAEEMTASVTEGGGCGWTVGGENHSFFTGVSLSDAMSQILDWVP